ncbi:spore germination protein [Paenibacillus filicis]|uniref:Spore germination protein n=1 Tax=Paenibacillus gyeongsangnamensis TaxID=3388067 RepID=A0ABT4Q3J3_9BACL|nr:spore germination protein [Paenibacillus filicis]MCZ8511445.1 spore germination protein [Paenibacillus filicis]
MRTSQDLSTNLHELKNMFRNAPDLVIREIAPEMSATKFALAFIDSIIDKKVINTHILSPLLSEGTESMISVGKIQEADQWKVIEEALLHGNCILFIEGQDQVKIIEAQGWPKRSIEKPQLENSLTGSQQGFVETVSENIALIRRYIPKRELSIKEFQVGQRGETNISLLYLSDVASPELLSVLEERIKLIKADGIYHAGELSEYIQDQRYSIIPQFLRTERPDVTAKHLLEGRYAILIDLSPSLLIGPINISTFFKTIDDYNSGWFVATFLRFFRYIAFFITLFLPAVYIALISFSYEVIPVKLLLSIGIYRNEVPFPPFIEALIMEMTMEMLREAGLRLPQPLGQTIGIVGGIVIGQAAVQAGIVSNLMVIIVSITAISSYIIPNFDFASVLRHIRFPIMLVASLFGFIGIIVAFLTLIAHLISLESLENPFGKPMAPLRLLQWKDFIVRFPLKK